MGSKITNITELESIAENIVVLNRNLNTAIYNSNCECPDSDGCDGDCGSDCYDSSG